MGGVVDKGNCGLIPLPEAVDGDTSAASRVQTHLRRLVLDGTLAPGTEFSQVELARVLGVSRTPLREALRMLQEEGLIEAEVNRKARIAGCRPEELDALYAARVGLESVAVAMTARSRDEELLIELDELLVAMETAHADFDAFLPVHRHFHRRLVSGAPPAYLQLVHLNQDRSERYWRLMDRTEGAAHPRRDQEHRRIVAAVRARDDAGAAMALARHLTRSALTLIGHLAPDRDVPATRAAVRLIAAT